MTHAGPWLLIAFAGWLSTACSEAVRSVPLKQPRPQKTTTATEKAPPIDGRVVRSDVPLVRTQDPWHARADAHAIRRADAELARERTAAAANALTETQSPAAALLRARIARAAGDAATAQTELERASVDPWLTGLVALERGLVALDKGDARAASQHFLTLFDADNPAAASDGATEKNVAPTEATAATASNSLALRQRAVLPTLEALLANAPTDLLRRAATLEMALPPEDVDARSLWLAAQARAATALGRHDQARTFELQRYLEEPVSTETPDEPPQGTAPTPAELLGRAEVLLEAHRNERVLSALASIPQARFTASERCRHDFARGMAARKLHHYAEAETYLERAAAHCADEELIRRAMYVQAKVVSIRAGLRAIPIIERFSERFADHTMVDDVLFWAGDLHQRRRHFDRARAYYQRATRLSEPGDHCAEAAWRIAWMLVRQGKNDAAQKQLATVVADTHCPMGRFERARAAYWQARLVDEEDDAQSARTAFQRARAIDPLGFYGQLAQQRLAELGGEKAAPWPPPPQADEPPPLCPGFLANEPALERSLAFLARGLSDDAAHELRTIVVPETPPAVEKLSSCGPGSGHLLLARLLDEAGAHREAHWLLRSNFDSLLAVPPTPESIGLWRAAYPLAFRNTIEAAENEAGLPTLFLQALAREESALDPQVVSWAGAYGLTQLLLSSGQRAGRLLRPKVQIETAEELLEPGLNARLGAALLASLLKKLGGHPGLALAAYNAGDNVALTWWKRHQGQPFDRYAEEITIKETRGYVQRVLTTFGIYRWLYAGEPPVLPVKATLPAR